MGFAPPPDFPPPPATPSVPLPPGGNANVPAQPDLPAPPVLPGVPKSITIGGTIHVAPSFELSPPVTSLCGFTSPLSGALLKAKLAIGIKLPSITIPLPSIDGAVALNCSLKNPISVTGGVAWGGGRTLRFDADPDLGIEDEGSGLSFGGE